MQAHAVAGGGGAAQLLNPALRACASSACRSMPARRSSLKCVYLRRQAGSYPPTARGAAPSPPPLPLIHGANSPAQALSLLCASPSNATGGEQGPVLLAGGDPARRARRQPADALPVIKQASCSTGLESLQFKEFTSTAGRTCDEIAAHLGFKQEADFRGGWAGGSQRCSPTSTANRQCTRTSTLCPREKAGEALAGCRHEGLSRLVGVHCHAGAGRCAGWGSDHAYLLTLAHPSCLACPALCLCFSSMCASPASILATPS